MADENYRIAAARRKRVQRLKNIIIDTVTLVFLSMLVCCVILFFRVNRLNRKLDDLTVQIEQLTQKSMEQQRMLEQWMESTATKVQETAAAGQTEWDVPVTDKLQEEAESEIQVEAMQKVSVPEAAHKVYLTFDDGPGKCTGEILEILDRYNVKATFFVTGKEGEASEDVMRAIVDAGHTIGLHSYSHKYSELYHSVEDFAADFERLRDYVYQVTGVNSTVYRFPGGSSNKVSELDMQEFVDYLDSQGVEFYDWNISSGDGSSILLDVQTLVKNCTSSIEKYDTAIILMHDSADKSTTVEALPMIIESIQAMEDTVILPITEETVPVHHIDTNSEE